MVGKHHASDKEGLGDQAMCEWIIGTSTKQVQRMIFLSQTFIYSLIVMQTTSCSHGFRNGSALPNFSEHGRI